MTEATVCESCGAEDAEVHPVRRVYLVPDEGSPQPRRQVLDDVERWCVACLTNYPHEPAL